MRPQMRSLEFTRVTEWMDGRPLTRLDSLAAEEPLEIRIGDVPIAVTMRTPGHDVELAAGFLLTEGIVEDYREVGAIRTPCAADQTRNFAAVELCGEDRRGEHLRRNFFAASSCGICGKASIDAIRRRGLRTPDGEFRTSPELLCRLPEAARQGQVVFERTGGLHAAALFNGSGELLVVREDIGRHNAVDKVVGWAAFEGRLPLSDHILLVSGRGGFEIVQKALAAGIPVLACVSAPSSLAVRLARELGLTLVGFLRERRFVVYSGEGRIRAGVAARSDSVQV